MLVENMKIYLLVSSFCCCNFSNYIYLFLIIKIVPRFLVSSAIVTDGTIKPKVMKEKCKYYPACGKGETCEFSHPTPCKTFPNCKFGEQCLYFHPRCKFDLTCTRVSCVYSHTTIVSSAPPLCK